jgi:hypothetical protein
MGQLGTWGNIWFGYSLAGKYGLKVRNVCGVLVQLLSSKESLGV